MKRILTIFILASAQQLYAQDASKEIKQHYHVMDSLWNNDKYAELITYAKDVAPFFEKNNKYPSLDYYKLVTEYLAQTYIESNRYEEAEKLLLELLPVLEKNVSRVHPAYRDAAYWLGVIHLRTGSYTKAYSYYSLAWKSNSLWWQVQPWLYIKMGSELIGICTNLGKYDEAQACAKKIEESLTPGRYKMEALLDYYIAVSVLYTQMMSLQKAAFYIQKATALLPAKGLNIYTKTELKNVEAMALMGAGAKDTAATILFDLLKELDSLKLKNTDPWFLTLGNVSNILLLNDAIIQGDSLLTLAITGNKTPKNKYMGALYMNLALFKTRRAEYQMALSLIDTARSIFSLSADDDLQVNIPANILRPVLLLKLKRYIEAQLAYEQFMSGYTSYIKKNISTLSETDKNSITLAYYHSANFAPSFIPYLKKEEAALMVKRNWNHSLFYKGLAAGEQGKLYAALRKSTDTALHRLFDDWKELKQFLRGEYKKPVMLRSKFIDSLAMAAEKKEKALLSYLPQKTETGSDDMVQQIYQSLKPGEAVVDFCRYSRFTHALVDSQWYGAYVLRHGSPVPVFRNLCTEDTLRALFGSNDGTSSMAALIGQFYPSAVLNSKSNSRGNTLYRLTWQPLAKDLENSKTVYIITDGLLHKIAFHALPAGKNTCLSDIKEIRYLQHAGSICKENFRVYKKPTGVQVWAGINYNANDKPKKKGLPGELVQQNKSNIVPGDDVEEDWTPLQGAGREGELVKKICGANHVTCTLFSGTAATETQFKQSCLDSSDVLHVATHGKFYPNYFKSTPDFNLYSNMPFTLSKDPMQQVGLVMAGRNQLKYSTENVQGRDDCILRASEIAQLNLGNKQLVVLNACETGLGDIISSEGVFGMTRAFKMAGAEKILISLWAVDDEQSGEMMGFFYKSLLKDKGAAAALRAAQQHMKKKYPPYYWAGYLLIE
jgi:CHAT domain-containing protein/tetratricopeptide (TPR) repeat protein